MVVAIPLVATVSLALVLHSAVVLSLSRPRIISSLHRFLGFSLVWARKHDGDLNQDGSAPLTLALLLNLNVGSTEIPDDVDIGYRILLSR